VALLAGLIWHMPVTQLSRFVELPPEIKLQGVTGKLYSGQVDRVVFRGHQIDELAYRLQPSCFFQLSLCYGLVSRTDPVNLNLRFSPLTQTLQVFESGLDVDASVAATVPGLLVKPSGRFRLEVRNLELTPQGKVVTLDGDVYWEDAGVVGENQILGNYRARLETGDNELSIDLSDEDALLGIKGNASLRYDGGYRIDLEINTQPELDPGLESMLRTMTRKTGLSRYQVRQNGQLSGAQLKQFASVFALQE
jgi:general secretion pathway protein N